MLVRELGSGMFGWLRRLTEGSAPKEWNRQAEAQCPECNGVGWIVKSYVVVHPTACRECGGVGLIPVGPHEQQDADESGED